MKKLLSVCLLLVACSEPTVMDNSLCIKQKFFYVVQSLDNGTIVQLCPENYSEKDTAQTCIQNGTLAFIIDNQNKFSAKQMLVLPENLCFVAVGQNTYTTAKGKQQTIPRLQILPDKLPYHKLVTAEDI